MDVLHLSRAFDAHLHLREGSMLETTIAASAPWADAAVVMPNLSQPVIDAVTASLYRDALVEQCERMRLVGRFTPLMTIMLTDATTPTTIAKAKSAGVVAAKLYPRGATTNSSHGVLLDDVRSGVFDPAFHAMEDAGLILCLHGEDPDVFVMSRESSFLGVAVTICSRFRKLRVVLEHISTAAAVDLVKDGGYRNLAATVTPHHLVLTLDDVIGGLLNPHAFCKPVVKRPYDRHALQKAVLGGDHRFFLGTDSAPHARERKECAQGCAGVFNAPVAMPVLAELFEANGALEMLERFISKNGRWFYHQGHKEAPQMTLAKEPWEVPGVIGGVVPLMAGKTLSWAVI